MFFFSLFRICCRLPLLAWCDIPQRRHPQKDIGEEKTRSFLMMMTLLSSFPLNRKQSAISWNGTQNFNKYFFHFVCFKLRCKFRETLCKSFSRLEKAGRKENWLKWGATETLPRVIISVIYDCEEARAFKENPIVRSGSSTTRHSFARKLAIRTQIIFNMKWISSPSNTNKLVPSDLEVRQEEGQYDGNAFYVSFHKIGL